MPYHALRFADLPALHDEPDYLPCVAHALRTAYAHLKSGPHHLDRYVRALAAVEPIRLAPMAERQLVRVLFVEALAYAAMREMDAALKRVSIALELAEPLVAPGERLDLLYLSGSLHRAQLRFAAAADAYEAYLHLLQGSDGPTASLDDALAAAVAVQLAGAAFFLAQYDVAEHWLQVARQMASSGDAGRTGSLGAAEADSLQEGTCAWLEGQLERWRERPGRAVRPAAAAAAIYSRWGNEASAARSHLALAEILLDVALRRPEGTERETLVERAGQHMALGARLAHAAGDPIGQHLTTLTRVRVEQVGQPPCVGCTERLDQVAAVVRAGQQAADIALQAQARTVLGNQLIAAGQLDAGLEQYREVKVLLAKSEVPALGVWALRALHQLETV